MPISIFDYFKVSAIAHVVPISTYLLNLCQIVVPVSRVVLVQLYYSIFYSTEFEAFVKGINIGFLFSCFAFSIGG